MVDMNIIAGLITIIFTWLGFNEKRMSSLRAEFKEKIADREEINRIIQNELKGDINRLEGKIDSLLQVVMDNSRSSNQSKN